MTDDIVTRLRNGLFYEVWDDKGIHWQSDISNRDIWEAIQEIERLRAEYEHCRLQMLMYQRIAELGPQAVNNEHN